jgi:hypothetical protein
MEFLMKKLTDFCALLFAVVAGMSPAAAAPTDASQVLTFKANQLCKYAVQLTVSGKSNVLVLPGDRFTVASPGQQVTVTNLRTGEEAAVLITGPTHGTVQADGTTEITVNGLNIVLNAREAKSARPGIFLLEGNFNFALKADGSEARVFSGTGDVTDICALLA